MKVDNIYKEEKKSAFAKLSEIIITMASRPSGLIGLSILVFHIILAFIFIKKRTDSNIGPPTLSK